MIAPDGSNGDAGPTSTTKPLSFSALIHVTVVPVFTQKSELAFAPGMPGVEVAESEVRFTSTVHGLEADPQVLAVVQSCAGFTSVQAYLLPFDCAVAWLKATNVMNRKMLVAAKHRLIFITHLTIWRSAAIHRMDLSVNANRIFLTNSIARGPS